MLAFHFARHNSFSIILINSGSPQKGIYLNKKGTNKVFKNWATVLVFTNDF